MIVTPASLAWIAGRPVNGNMASTVLGLAAIDSPLARPLQPAMFLGQLAHESGGWNYDREIWGNTPAQRGYDTRTDLGNTPQADGDGYRYRGRGPLQLTGRANYRVFTAWTRRQFLGCPDFEADPDAVNRDPWEGLSAVWFWIANKIEPPAEAADVARVTRIVNGGQNGLADRIRYTDRALQFLAGAVDLKSWQAQKGLVSDGALGPLTRGVLVAELRGKPKVTFAT